MSYEVLQTCLLVPGVSASNCAGWVQAWGSIIGLGVAIGVPLWLRRTDREHAAATDRATYEVTGASVLLRLPPALGCARAVINAIDAYKPGFTGIDLSHLSRMLRSLTLPDESQMLAIAKVDPGLALLLVRGVNLLIQAEHALDLLAQQNVSSGDLRDLSSAIKEPLYAAHDQLTKAKESLDKGLR